VTRLIRPPSYPGLRARARASLTYPSPEERLHAHRSG
jgi:hypothetical protein